MNRLLLALIIMILTCILCTNNSSIVYNDNGGGSEITGYLVTSDASPAENASVILINPLFTDTFFSTTDQNGKYVFTKAIPDGRYTLQGSRDSLACILFNLRYDQSYKIRTDTLRNTGWIYASAFLEKSTYRQGIDVYIPGTSITGKTDSSGGITFWSVPPGNYQIRFDRHGYVYGIDSAHVLSGLTDTVGPVTLARDLSVPVEIPVPTGLKATADIFLGTVSVTWDSSTQNIQGYYIRIIDTLVNRYPKEGNILFTKSASFTDPVFAEKILDTTSQKFRVYQIRIADNNWNEGQWGQLCSLLVRKPVVPPAPSCSLLNIPESLSVSVFTSLPNLWWIDSLIINRTVFSDLPGYNFALPLQDNLCWKDLLSNLPIIMDSLITITYTVRAKSIYGCLSQPSQPVKTVISNPYRRFVMKPPSQPYGLPARDEAGTYVAQIIPVNSPLPDDVTEYRLLISRDSDTVSFYTDWYTNPSIEVSLNSESKWFLQSQARSRWFPGLLSQLSDTCTVTIHKAHTIQKPSVPVGNSLVIHSNPYSYISTFSDTCSNGHQISVRYVVSYQGESASDSTDWGSVSTNATLYWSKPGIAYLRAQARCVNNPLIVSPWSDALVVTVE